MHQLGVFNKDEGVLSMTKIPKQLACWVLMLAALAILSSVGTMAADVRASGTCGENVTWTLYADGRLVLSGSGSMTDYASANDSYSYSYRRDITSIEIGEGITRIGDYAFYDCIYVTEVTIPESVQTIGYEAFYGCNGLEQVNFGSGVTSIESWAFGQCSSLRRIVIPDQVQTIGNAAFFSCSHLSEVEIGNGVVSIGEGAFNFCRELSLVYLGGSVTRVGADAFYNNGKAVAYFDGSYTAWTALGLDFGNRYHVAYASGACGDSLRWTLYDDGFLRLRGSGRMLDYSAAPWIDWCSDVRRAELPEGLTNIGNNAFAFCSAMADITIPTSVTSIGANAFQSCSALKSVVFPAGLEEIGASAFMYTGLESITLPERLHSIGASAFEGCSALASANIPEGVTSIGETAFLGCSALKSVKIPSAVTEISLGLFASSGLESVTIPERVTAIGERAFINCGSLAAVTIPATVTSIGDYAFESCGALTDVYYGGTAAQWGFISIGENNTRLNGAAKHYAATISFSANSGEGSMEPQATYTDVPTALTVCTFTRERYIFIGWNTAADGSGTAYADEEEVTLSDDLTLFAQWTKVVAEIDSVQNVTVDDDPACKIEIYCGDSANLTVFCARYDADGRFLGVEAMALVPGENEFTVLRKGAAVVGFFVLDNTGFAPVCGSVSAPPLE